MTWAYQPFPVEAAAPADDTPGNACLSLDVCVEGLAQPVEYYATDSIQGTQCAPLADAPPEATIVQTSVPEYLVDEMFEPGVFWFQTGPPTSLDDETGQTRGQTCLPDYLEPDDQIDPSDADWQNPTTSNDATCAAPYVAAEAFSRDATAVTTHPVSLPSANIGDVYLVWTQIASTSLANGAPTFPDGWTRLFVSLTTAFATDYIYAAAFKVVDGTEGGSVSFTTVGSARSVSGAFTICNADTSFAPEYVTLEDANNIGVITPNWGATPWLALSLVVIPTQITVGTFPTNMPMARNAYAPAAVNGSLASAAAQVETATFDPGIFGAILAESTIGVYFKGYCLDGLNDDPAGRSVPSDLEPEAEVDCYGWQSQGPVEDPSSAPVDDLLTVTSIPDWLEPDAEPNPEDIGSGGWSMGASDDGTICYFPVIESTATYEAVTQATSHGVTMPSGITSGDKLVMFVWGEGTVLTPPSGWTRISASTAAEGQVFVKTADGTEGATEVVSSGSAIDLGAITYRISTPYVGPDWYALASEPTNDQLNPPLTHGFADRQVVWIVAKLLSNTQKTTAPTGFTGIITADSGSVSDPPWGATAHKYDVATSITPDDWNSTNADTSFTLAVRGVCIGEDFTPASQWTAVTEPPEDVFEEAPEWVKTPQQDFAGDDDPAPHYFPDDLEPEAEPLQDGWQQQVTVEDFPLDPEIPLTSIPADLEPEAEVDTEGWRSAPLHDFPDNADINGRSVPDSLEPEAEIDAFGWASEPLHDTPSTADITGTSVPDTLTPEDEVDTDGWAFRLPDLEAYVPPPEPEATSTGTLPGHFGRKRWWLEDVSKEEAKRRKRADRWPDIREPETAPPWKPKVVTNKTKRPRLSAIDRDWKEKLRKARKTDDILIATIIAMMLAEDKDGSD